MAELKPVPSGYDSQALSSMLGYLANARKSHDNNPFMRTILDQQARDNKQEYLADADLTRNAQMDDNEYARLLNIVQLRQKDASERASRGSSMFNATGGAVQTDPLTADQNMNAQDPENMDAILNSLGLDKMLDPIKKQGEIGKIAAETENTQLGSVIHRLDAGDDRDIADITRQPKDVNVDLNNSLRRRVSSAQGENAVVRTNTQVQGEEALGNVLEFRNAAGEIEYKKLTDYETRRYSTTPEGKAELAAMQGSIRPSKGRSTVTNQVRETSNGNAEPQKAVSGVAFRGKASNIDPTKDIESAKAWAAEQGLSADGVGMENGKVYITINGQRVTPRPRQE
jgi:hypothetical protein